MIIKCKICKSTDIVKINKVLTFKLLRCLKCQVVFIFPQPRKSSVEKNNLQIYDSECSAKQYFNMQKIFHRRAETSISILKKYIKKGEILDVGCNYGFYLQSFKKEGYNTCGIDISKNVAEYNKTKMGIKTIVGKFDTYNFKDKNFDIITMFDVLEHFSDPQEVIDKVKKNLKNNGVIIIQTPNFQSIMSRITGLKWSWLLIPQHQFIFSIKTLKILLKNNGFKVLYISTWDDLHEFINNILLIFGIKSSGKSELIHRILVKIKYVLFPISILWNSYNLGGEILIYAQKE